MGLTIHFSGTLKSEHDYEAVLSKGRALAERLGSEAETIDSPCETLIRVKDEQIVESEDKVRGILFQPHPRSEPITLLFDSDNFVQQFCKTQFAGIATHIEVIGFLRSIEPHFDNFKVVDKGEFWGTNDIERLEKKFADFTTAIDLLGKFLENGTTEA